MAWLESTIHQPREYSVDENNELVETVSGRAPIDRLPQIFWEDGTPWSEVNVWALQRVISKDVLVETAQRQMKHLCRYASFLETENLDWHHFPIRKDERVLVKFRGRLIQERDEGIIEPSTASACMNAVIMFYRFADIHKLVGAVGPMWENRTVTLTVNDRAGFKRTINKISTDLRIKHTGRVPSVRLEEGLLPLRSEDMTVLVTYTSKRSTVELHLMLSTGFFTGARVGTVVTLTVSCLHTAREIPEWPGVYYLPVGPGTKVATKHSVKGNLLVPRHVLDDLKEFSGSTERLKREARALPEHKDVLFLTRTSKPYSVDTVGSLIRGLRTATLDEGMLFMENFRFHFSRATFGTTLLEILLEHLPPIEALGIVKDALFHKDETTTFDYLKFRERTAAKQAVAAEYHHAFTGRRHVDWDKKDA